MEGTLGRKGVDEIAPDWSFLPAGPLGSIAGKMIKLSDYIRFRSVCLTWRSAAPPSGLSRKQPPILLVSQDPRRDDGAVFFCPTTAKLLRPHLPELRGKHVLTISQGWMLIIDKQSKALLLFNPVSTDQILLPPTSTFENLVNSESYWVAFISSTPSAAASEFVVIVLSSIHTNKLAYCRPGDTHWSEANVDISLKSKPYIAYQDGDFYTLGRYNYISRRELKKKSAFCGVIDGEIYYLKFGYRLQCSNFYVTDVRVYKSEFELINQYSKVHNFGSKNVLFLSTNQLFMVNVEGFPGWKEDCIYFPSIIARLHIQHGQCAVYAINLNADLQDYMTWGELDCRPELDPVWLIPSLC